MNSLATVCFFISHYAPPRGTIRILCYFSKLFDKLIYVGIESRVENPPNNRSTTIAIVIGERCGRNSQITCDMRRGNRLSAKGYVAVNVSFFFLWSSIMERGWMNDTRD